MYFEFFKNEIKDYLISNNIDISDYHYKDSENYKKIKDERVFSPSGDSMSLEEFIERYLMTGKVFDVYESKYDMGSQYEYDDDECEVNAVAKEIAELFYEKNNVEIDEAELVNNFYRSGGLIERLKKYLNLDLCAFDKNNKKYKWESCKILYFFYMLENRDFKGTNILELLSKPSMENIDNSFIGMETCNGLVIKTIKDSLEKEISLSVKTEIKTETREIVGAWDGVLDNARYFIDFLAMKGHKYDFEQTIHRLLTDSKKPETKIIQYKHSPIEVLYLRMVQYEYLGNISDISKINRIEKDYTYNVPSELIGEMKKLHFNPININDIEQYIDKNALKISKYVYLGAEPSKEDVRRIRKSKEKVCKCMDFCCRARPLLDINEISNELQIISILQAIILDDSSETFDYAFHGWQKHMKHKPQVQAALKNDKLVVDALQTYWVRKVMDRWYANIDRYDDRIKLRELEQACDSILEEILQQSCLDEMMETHRFYWGKLGDELTIPLTSEQINAVQCLENYLCKLGFKYIDDVYKIRYLFLAPHYISETLNKLFGLIEDAICDHDSVLEIESEDADETIFVELVFDYEHKECIMEKFEWEEA